MTTAAAAWKMNPDRHPLSRPENGNPRISDKPPTHTKSHLQAKPRTIRRIAKRHIESGLATGGHRLGLTGLQFDTPQVFVCLDESDDARHHQRDHENLGQAAEAALKISTDENREDGRRVNQPRPPGHNVDPLARLHPDSSIYLLPPEKTNRIPETKIPRFPGQATYILPGMKRYFLATGVFVAALITPAMAQTALEQGKAFLAQNASKPGVKQTPSGLQYKILEPGTGKSPKATDTVLVNYRGTLLDGKEFDSSYKRNEPIEFPLNRVIPGWTEGVQLIKEGGKIQLFIPPDLAYGSHGAGGAIGPNETLIFEVELLKVR